MPKKETTKKIVKTKTAAKPKKKAVKTEKKKVEKKEEKPKVEKKIEKPKEEKIDLKEETMLVPNDDYLSSGIHIGTKHSTTLMKKYVYKVREDGLCILNVQLIDKKIKEVSDLINKFKPEEILISSRRDIGMKPIKLLGMATGIKTITGRYLPGTLTNPNYKDYYEPKVVMVTDVWHDRTLLLDAVKTGAAIIALANTNNNAADVDLIIPCNNKGKKSVALIYWIIAREYCKAHNIKFEYTLDQFV